MFNKEKIIEILNSEDFFIDGFILDAFIKNWKIEPIYEDADGVEFYDEMALEKIRNGIKPRQPKCEIDIIDKEIEEPSTFTDEPKAALPEIGKNEIEIVENTHVVSDVSNELPVSILNEVNQDIGKALKNVTLDISNQTLAVLAESIARKITCDVSDYLKKAEFFEDAISLGEYKKDNQILLKRIDELVSDNKVLVKRIEELEKECNSFVKLFGNLYVKNN